MRVVQLIAGAGGMYCGSCLRDNRLAATLLSQGRDVVLLPLYTPIRTDEVDVSARNVYYGGISVYLRQKSAWFRRLPVFIDRLVNLPMVLRAAARASVRTSPEDLGALAVSVLKGPEGAQRRELQELISALRGIGPHLVHLPNLLFVGLVREIKIALGIPVLCSLAGEDIFTDALPEPYRRDAFALIREGAKEVDGFLAPTRYYGDHATRHFGLRADRVHFVPMGIHVEHFSGTANPAKCPFVIVYLARICPEKGLHVLVDALAELRRAGRDCRLRAAGYLGAGDRDYFKNVIASVRRHGLDRQFEYVGEVTREEKSNLLKSAHVFSVPTVYREAKGLYVLEAFAAGVPVVQPRHGSFPELVSETGGGVLCNPNDPSELARAIAALMDDESSRLELSNAGRNGVLKAFADTNMAERTWDLYASITGAKGSGLDQQIC